MFPHDVDLIYALRCIFAGPGPELVSKSMPDAPTFAADEVYDRQIRLWGTEAQSRMQNSRVLFVGMRALQAEVCKNVVLAGINVTLMDYRPVTHTDLASHFYLREEHVGKNRAEACLPGVKEMNPLADVRCHTESPAEVPDDFFTRFDIICASDIDINTMVRLDNICRASKKCFMYTDTFGFDGLALIDLGTHMVLPEGEKGQEKVLTFPPIEDVLKTPWSSLKDRFPISRVFVSGQLLRLFEAKHGRRPTEQNDADNFLDLSHKAFADNGLPADFISDDALRRLAQLSMAELSATCAVVGGIIGQEVLKAISLKGDPAFNCFVWDGQTQEGRVLKVPLS